MIVERPNSPIEESRLVDDTIENAEMTNQPE